MHGIFMNFHYRVSPLGKNVEDFDHTPLDPLLPGPIETGEGGRFSTRSWANLGIGWPWKINIEPTRPSKPPWLCCMFFLGCRFLHKLTLPPKIGPHKRKGSFEPCCDSGQLIDRFQKLTIYFAWRWLQEVTLIWWEWDAWACSNVCCKIGVIVANYFHLHNFGMIWKRPEHWKNTQISEPHLGVFVPSILLMHFLFATLDWWIAPDPAQTTAWLWPLGFLQGWLGLDMWLPCSGRCQLSYINKTHCFCCHRNDHEGHVQIHEKLFDQGVSYIFI